MIIVHYIYQVLDDHSTCHNTVISCPWRCIYSPVVSFSQNLSYQWYQWRKFPLHAPSQNSPFLIHPPPFRAKKFVLLQESSLAALAHRLGDLWASRVFFDTLARNMSNDARTELVHRRSPL